MQAALYMELCFYMNKTIIDYCNSNMQYSKSFRFGFRFVMRVLAVYCVYEIRASYLI